MTDGEKKVLGAIAVITGTIWLYGQYEKHEVRARAAKKVKEKEKYPHGIGI